MTETKEPIAGNRMAEKDIGWMYFLGKTPYLPHYKEEDVYVSPGGFEKKENDLLNKGAKKVSTYIWPRVWQQKKAKKNG